MSIRLSVTLVSCAQTAGRIEMLFGMEVGLGQCHIVLDGDLHPPTGRGHFGGGRFGPLWSMQGKLNDTKTKALFTVRRRRSFISIFAVRCYGSAPYVVMRCLSRSCILSKRINVSSSKFFHLVYPCHSSFSTPNSIAIFRREPSPLRNGGVKCRWGGQKSRFWAYIWLDCLC